MLRFRSKFEKKIASELQDQKIDYQYEGPINTLSYVIPEQSHVYVCDFFLPNGILIETKGRFSKSDRKKHLYVRSQYPDLDIRFCFMYAKNKINKRSTTTYADWCDKHDFFFCENSIPKEWLREEKSSEEFNKIMNILVSI